MRYKFDVVMDDGTAFAGVADGRDVRAWEAMRKQSFVRNEFSYTTIAELAYLCLRRTAGPSFTEQYPNYETFDGLCVDLSSPDDAKPDPGNGELIADPTRLVATDGSFATSPGDSGVSPLP